MRKVGIISGSIVIGLLLVFGVVALGKFPIPSDALVGLYHPYRDLFQAEYPNGIPFKNFLLTDPVRQQYPFRFLAISEMATGQLPLWNPYNLSGTPLLAGIQAAPFYPLNILFVFFSFQLAWSILVFLQPILMAVFMYAYLRNLSISRIAGALAGLSFGLSGFSVSWMEWNTIGHTAVWLPLILLSIDKLIAKHSSENTYRFSVFARKVVLPQMTVWTFIYFFSLVSAFFAGHLQTFVYLFCSSVAYLLFRVLTNDTKKVALRPLLWAAGLFILVTSVLWIPFVQFLFLSGRQGDLLGYKSEGWFIPIQHLIQFVIPDFFGNPATLNYFGTWNYGEMVGYVGLLPLLLAIFAIVFVRKSPVFFFSGLLLVALLFAVETPLAVLPFILDLPFFSTAQPTRLLFLIVFSLSVLSGFGFHFFQNEYKKFGYVIGVCTLLMLSVWVSIMFFSEIFGIGAENIAVARRNSILPTLFLGIVLIGYLLVTVVNKKRFTVLVMILFLAVTVFDLSRFMQKFLPFTSDEYLYPKTKVLKFLSEDRSQFRIMTTDNRILPANVTIMYGIQTVDGYDPLYLLRYGELIAASERGEPNITPPFGFNRIISPTQYNSSIMDMLGVKYILSLTLLEGESLSKVYEEGETSLYENSDALDRAFFVENIIMTSSKQETIDEMFQPELNFADTAIVEVTDEVFETEYQKGTVEIVEYLPNRVILRTENEGEGFLVLTDSYYPTWRVKIDGVEGEIVRTNYAVRGVVVPQGEHAVEFYNTLFAL